MSKMLAKRVRRSLRGKTVSDDVQIGPGGDAAETRKDEVLLTSSTLHKESPTSHDPLAVNKESPTTHDLLAMNKESPTTHDLLAMNKESPTTHDLPAMNKESPTKASEEEAAKPEEDAYSRAGSEIDTDYTDLSLRANSPSEMSVTGSEVILTAKVMKEENDLEKLEKKEEEKEEAQIQKQKELWSHMDEDTREMRYLRLKTLLTKSNLYTEYLMQRMDRQKEEEAKRKEREMKKLKKIKEKEDKDKEAEENKLSGEKSPPSSQGQRKMSLRAPVPRSQLSSPRTPLSPSQNNSLPSSPKSEKEAPEDPIPALKSENVNHTGTRQEEKEGVADFQDCLREYLGEDVIPLSPMLATKTEQSGSTPKRGRKRKTDEAGTLTNFFKPAGKNRKTESETSEMETINSKTDRSKSHPNMKKTEEESAVKLEAVRDATGKVIKPALLTGGTLRPYQVEGFNWLRLLFENGVNGILADEMGLGKTIQCIAAVSEFIDMSCPGPFLVVAPLSTLPNWKSEFQKFAPKIPTLFYHGSKDERARLRKKIYKRHNVLPDRQIQPVVLTSYEIAMRDQPHLKNCNWNYLIVDEGHRLKNRNCRLIRELKQYKNAHRLLLTGTPLQNNLCELWSLLNFLLPEIFDDMSSFETWFDVEVISDEAADEAIIREEKKKNILGMLHQILTPFMLRRVKTDVDLEIPPKKEIMVFAPLSECQEEFYKTTVDRTILRKLAEKNKSPEEPVELTTTGRPRRSVSRKSIDYRAMLECDEEDSDVESWVENMLDNNNKPSASKKEGKQKSAQLNISLRNVMMQLRKVCNHPYLLEYPLDEAGNYKVDEDLIQKCGKMMVLDKMLTELRKRQHKVLIFSQMTRMLDILEDYLNFKGMTFCRLDGSTPVEDRRVAMDTFNNEADMFVFLLSTKAGGLGINLTGGDTVIIYDSDWNPQNDLQAQDRCHRIGQTKPVVVYRLVTANTIDHKIVERAAAKRKLEKMIIKKGKFKSGIANYSSELKPLNPDELMELLKSRDYQGTVEGGCVMSEKELDALMDRSDMIQQFENIKQGKTVEDDEPEDDVLRTSSKESCQLFETLDYDAGGTTLVSQQQHETTS